MATVERFEDLRVWQAAREIVEAIYKASSAGGFSRDYALRDQIRRAAISIPSNIAEGFSRRSNKEFIQFLFIVHPMKYMRRFLFHGAGGSAAEVQSQLYTALDLGYLSEDEFQRIFQELETLSKQVSKLISYLRKAD